MGRDKATIEVDGLTLARRTAGLLSTVCPASVEVGPGHTGLDRVEETAPGAGPLAAVADARRALVAAGWAGPALVVATDLPRLTADLLVWLAAHPASGSVVPVAGGRAQLLCARWSPADLDRAVALVGAGERAMRLLLGEPGVVLAGEDEWAGPAGGTSVLDDADTPADLARLGFGGAGR